jgi:hypothetical protein
MCRSCETVYEDFSLKEGTVLKENELRLVRELIKKVEEEAIENLQSHSAYLNRQSPG